MRIVLVLLVLDSHSSHSALLSFMVHGGRKGGAMITRQFLEIFLQDLRYAIRMLLRSQDLRPQRSRPWRSGSGPTLPSLAWSIRCCCSHSHIRNRTAWCNWSWTHPKEMETLRR